MRVHLWREKSYLKRISPPLIRFPFPVGTMPVVVSVVCLSSLSTEGQEIGKAEDIVFTEDRVNTIPHDMSKAEYPYDPGGRYRKEWVKTSAKSPEKTSVTVRGPISSDSREPSNYASTKESKQEEEQRRKVAEQKRLEELAKIRLAELEKKRQAERERSRPASGQTRLVNYTEPGRAGFIGPYEVMNEPAGSPTKVARESSSLTHKVNAGDTLYSIGRRYGVSVQSLKKANGLTSDLIRVGQSLRLALAQHVLGPPGS